MAPFKVTVSFVISFYFALSFTFSDVSYVQFKHILTKSDMSAYFGHKSVIPPPPYDSIFGGKIKFLFY